MYTISVTSQYAEGPTCPVLVERMPSARWILNNVVDWAKDFDEKAKVTRGDAAGRKAGETSARMVMEWSSDSLLVVVHKVEVTPL